MAEYYEPDVKWLPGVGRRSFCLSATAMSSLTVHCGELIATPLYLKVKGQSVYLNRAVDKQGRTVDFLLSKRRDVAAAKRFFSRVVRQHGAPRVINLDGYAASHRAVTNLKESERLPRRLRVQSCEYLNNVVEQDHRRIKQCRWVPYVFGEHGFERHYHELCTVSELRNTLRAGDVWVSGSRSSRTSKIS